MARQRKVWAIWFYQVGARRGGGCGYIQTSIGGEYADLRAIARRMNRNGEGARYECVLHSVSRELRGEP